VECILISINEKDKEKGKFERSRRGECSKAYWPPFQIKKLLFFPLLSLLCGDDSKRAKE